MMARPRIVIVADDPALLDAISRGLFNRRHEWEIVAATSDAAGVRRRVDAGDIDILVTDLNATASELILAARPHGHVRVVVITRDDVPQSLQSSVNVVLREPVHTQTLEAAVASLIALARARRARRRRDEHE